VSGPRLPSGDCYRYKPAKRPAIRDELLKKFLALRIIAVRPHENYAVLLSGVAWFSRWRNRIIEHRFLGAVKKGGAENSEHKSKVN
jgi:hypothetical protein